MNRYLGGYISCAGGLYKSVERAEELKINTMMIHPSVPQRWNTKPFKDEDIEKFNKTRKDAKYLERLFFHGIYLLNLANPDKQKFHLTKMSLVNYLELAEKIDSENTVVHTGTYKYNKTEQEGVERIVYGLKWIFDRAKSSKQLALEIAAGAGSVIGATFEDLARIYDALDENYKDRISFCIDTAHLWGSGYDLKQNLDKIITKMDNTIGIENISLIHFNDSKVELNSKKDRHENLGEGMIGEEAMKKFLNHTKLKDIPFVMETPGMKNGDTATEQVDIIKRWAE